MPFVQAGISQNFGLMKNLLIILVVAVGLAACGTADKKAGGSGDTTTVQWLDSTFMDLGKVTRDSVVEVAFHFKNTGDNNLIVENVAPGCGCTDPEMPKEPVAPVKEGVIKAKFKSAGQAIGSHTKNITVTANTAPSKTTQLMFRVDITEK